MSAMFLFKLSKIKPNVPEEFVFRYIAGFFNAVSAEICLKKPHCARLSSAYTSKPSS